MTLAACAQTGGTDFTPGRSRRSRRHPRTRDVRVPVRVGDVGDAVSHSTKAAVKATGTMSIYGVVSKALKGTCRTADGGPGHHH